MTEHAHSSLIEGCYRCELNLDEIEATRAEIETEAQAAWIAYRNDYARRNHLNARRSASQMRRREFIAGYLAANDIGALA